MKRSHGMLFSTSHCNPGSSTEVLAVVDREFQERCIEHMACTTKVEQLSFSLATALIEAVCDRVMWLQRDRPTIPRRHQNPRSSTALRRFLRSCVGAATALL